MMLTDNDTSSSPLISKSKPKTWLKSYIMPLIAFVLIASIFYFSMNDNAVANNAKSFVVDKESDNEEPKEKEEENKPSIVINIDYNTQDLANFTAENGMNDAESWTLFHDLLIKQTGYDPEEIKNDNDMMVSFHAHDDDEYIANFDVVALTDEDFEAYARGGGKKKGGKGGKGGRGGKGGKGSKTTSSPTSSPTYASGVHCYNSFVYGTSDVTIRAECGTHLEPGTDPKKGRPYMGHYADDRVSCMAVSGWTESDGFGVYTNPPSASGYHATSKSESICLDKKCHGTYQNYYYIRSCDRATNAKVAARCCVLQNPEGGNQWFGSDMDGNSNGWEYHELDEPISYDKAQRCETVSAKDTEVTLSCLIPAQSGSYGAYGGTKQVGKTCHSQTMDIRDSFASAITGYVTGGELSCEQVYSDSSNKDKDGVYVSTAQCPFGTSIFDCNGYLPGEIDYCSKTACKSTDNVIFSGAYFSYLWGEYLYKGKYNDKAYYSFDAWVQGRMTVYYLYVADNQYMISSTLGGTTWKLACDVNNVLDCGEGTWTYVNYMGEQLRTGGSVKECVEVKEFVDPKYQVFGAILDGEVCKAVGGRDTIRAQANCCSVVYDEE